MSYPTVILWVKLFDIMGSCDAKWPKITGTVTHGQGEDSFQGDTTTSCHFGNSGYRAGKLQLA